MVQSPVRDQSVRGRLPAARRDRRPALAALAVLLILLGALGSALIAFRSGDRVSVLVASRDIKVGQTVSTQDFRKVKVAGTDLQLVSGDLLGSYDGRRATVGVPQNSLINPQMFTRGGVVPEGAEQVGVVVTTKQRPGAIPHVGDVVRLYFVAGDSQQSGAKGDYLPGEPVVDAARVTAVSTGGGSDSRNITVMVENKVAGDVASLGSSGNLAVTIMPLDTEPDVDFTSTGQ
jgi:hypothetical protein